MSNDHRRFRQECIRAKEAGVQLIILTEEMPPFGQVALWEVPRWNSANQWHNYGEPMTLVDPAAFAKALDTMTERYGVKFRYCHRQQTPKVLIKYLRGELT